MSDFDFEGARGLPGRLPPGETLLWQGSPDWRSLAKHIFHIRFVAVYFGVLMAWRAVTAVYDGVPFAEAAQSLLWLALLAGGACAILGSLAYFTATTTVYSITTRRVVMHYGVALPMTLNIPFTKIESAALKLRSGDDGDIPLGLLKGEKIAYAVLWPHVRPWKLKRAEPMLRGLPKAAEVSQILARAFAAEASRPEARAAVEPLPPEVQPIRPAASARPAPAGERAVRIA